MSDLNPCIYHPGKDAYVDVKTLEPVSSKGRQLLPEWVGCRDMKGFTITLATLARICEENGL